MTRATGHAQLDGAPVAPAVIGTPTPFEVRGVPGNGVTAGTRPHPVTCWGLWVSLPPLSPGAHELTFGGSDGGRFRVEAQYRLVAS